MEKRAKVIVSARIGAASVCLDEMGYPILIESHVEFRGENPLMSNWLGERQECATGETAWHQHVPFSKRYIQMRPKNWHREWPRAQPPRQPQAQTGHQPAFIVLFSLIR